MVSLIKQPNYTPTEQVRNYVYSFPFMKMNVYCIVRYTVTRSDDFHYRIYYGVVF